MIQPLAGEAETGRNIFRLEGRQFFEHLPAAEAGGQKIQHVADADAHPSDAGPSVFGREFFLDCRVGAL